MIDKRTIRDPALVALIQHHGYACERNPDGTYSIRVPDAEFARVYKLFRLNYLPVFTRMRRLQRKLILPNPKRKS